MKIAMMYIKKNYKMEKGLKDILKRKVKYERKEIPNKIFGDESGDIPEKIRIIYKKKINTKHIKEIIEYKLKKLEKAEELKNFLEEEKLYREMYEEYNDKTCLELYLDTCSKYIKIERIKNITNKFLCRGCEFNLEESKKDCEGTVICPVCNCVNTYLLPNSYTRDIENNIFFFDEDTNNFIKILDKFEGKSTVILNDDFFEKLDDYFIGIGFKRGSEIKKLPLDHRGKKKGTNRRILWNALEKLGLSQYYDETSYIGNIYWGWDLPNLTKFKEQILRDYQSSQNVWNNLKGDYKRSASLGTQFRLYVHLMAVGFPGCDREDFKIQENVESLRLHNEAWKKMCQICDIKYFQVTN